MKKLEKWDKFYHSYFEDTAEITEVFENWYSLRWSNLENNWGQSDIDTDFDKWLIEVISPSIK